MQQNHHFIGIDFGTSNSCAAWFNPKTRRAETLLNEEREEKTPSIVFYDAAETLVGKPAENRIADGARLEGAARAEEMQRVVKSIKRNLLSPPRLPLPDGRDVRPVEVAAEILRKLKRDAQELHFHDEVRRAVITCPAVFDSRQRKVIKEAARLAGFEEVELLEEPVAAALAFGHTGVKVGKCVLVYDLGGGTFDLALLVRQPDGAFRVEMEPDGDARCGGDDFDLALYDHWDGQLRAKSSRPISLAESTVDLRFLHECRVRKENLSVSERCEFRSLIPGGRTFKAAITRATLEGLIAERIEKTVELTRGMVERARKKGFEVESLVLIGGSSEIPLVRQLLESRVGVKPFRWQHRDWAVALGAAYHARQTWAESGGTKSVKLSRPSAPGGAKRRGQPGEAQGGEKTVAATERVKKNSLTRKTSAAETKLERGPGGGASSKDTAARRGAKKAGDTDTGGSTAANALLKQYKEAAGRRDVVAPDHVAVNKQKAVVKASSKSLSPAAGSVNKGKSNTQGVVKKQTGAVQQGGSSGCVVLLAAALMSIAAGWLGGFKLAAALLSIFGFG